MSALVGRFCQDFTFTFTFTGPKPGSRQPRRANARQAARTSQKSRAHSALTWGVFAQLLLRFRAWGVGRGGAASPRVRFLTPLPTLATAARHPSPLSSKSSSSSSNTRRRLPPASSLRPSGHSGPGRTHLSVPRCQRSRHRRSLRCRRSSRATRSAASRGVYEGSLSALTRCEMLTQWSGVSLPSCL